MSTIYKNRKSWNCKEGTKDLEPHLCFPRNQQRYDERARSHDPRAVEPAEIIPETMAWAVHESPAPAAIDGWLTDDRPTQCPGCALRSWYAILLMSVESSGQTIVVPENLGLSPQLSQYQLNSMTASSTKAPAVPKHSVL